MLLYYKLILIFNDRNHHRIGRTHLDPIHKSGRGAGGNCFIKDFAAFKKLYKEKVDEDLPGVITLHSIESKNIDLLLDSNKDLDLLKGVYGDRVKEHKEIKDLAL